MGEHSGRKPGCRHRSSNHAAERLVLEAEYRAGLRSAKQIDEEWLIPFNAPLQSHLECGRTGKGGSTRMRWIGLLRSGNSGAIGGAATTAHTRSQIVSNLASGSASYASSSADTSGPDLANDDRPGTYWQCDDGQTSGWIRSICASRRASTRLQSSSRPAWGTMGRKRLLRCRVEAWSGGSGTRRLLASHPQ